MRPFPASPVHMGQAFSKFLVLSAADVFERLPEPKRRLAGLARAQGEFFFRGGGVGPVGDPDDGRDLDGGRGPGLYAGVHFRRRRAGFHAPPEKGRQGDRVFPVPVGRGKREAGSPSKLISEPGNRSGRAILGSGIKYSLDSYLNQGRFERRVGRGSLAILFFFTTSASLRMKFTSAVGLRTRPHYLPGRKEHQSPFLMDKWVIFRS